MNYEDPQQQNDDKHHSTLQQTTVVNGHQNSNFVTNNNNTIPKQSERPTSSNHVSTISTRYRECLRNHAVGLGRHAVDGCGEFIPTPTGDDVGAPESLTCAACSCHRNFHRKEQQQHTPQQNVYRWQQASSYSHNPYAHVAHPPPRRGFLALPPPCPDGDRCNIIGLDKRHENRDFNNNNNNALVKKRHRTKFSQEQKQKMLSFAESVAWRVQKQDGEVMQRFCDELGITRQVLKVWMHNNKSKKIILLEGQSSKNVSG